MTGTSSVPDETRLRPGRKRDAALREKILYAGLIIFTEEGWRGFTIDSVARAAGVGKSTMYLRYTTREDLAEDIMREYGYTTADVEQTGALRGDLESLTRSYARWLDGPGGLWTIRVLVEARLNPAFRESMRENGKAEVSRAHSIIRRAKRRGEIPSSASVSVILNSLIGGLTHYKLLAPLGGEEFSSPVGQAFIKDLVESVVAGATDPRRFETKPDSPPEKLRGL
jgi:AcrR family transcriptional regulator